MEYTKDTRNYPPTALREEEIKRPPQLRLRLPTCFKCDKKRREWCDSFKLLLNTPGISYIYVISHVSQVARKYGLLMLVMKRPGHIWVREGVTVREPRREGGITAN